MTKYIQLPTFYSIPFKIILIGLCFIVTLNCDRANNIPDSEKLSQQQLINVSENGISIVLNDLTNSIEVLHDNIEMFSQEINESNLLKLKESFLSAHVNLKRLEVYNISVFEKPLYDCAYWKFYHNSIEDRISNSSYNSYLQSLNQSPYSFGPTFSIIEYLLFKDDVSTTLNEMQNNQNRTDFLFSISEFIQQQLAYTNQSWENNKTRLTDSKKKYEELTNNIIHVQRELRHIRMCAIYNYFSTGDLNLSHFEAPYSKSSLDIIKVIFKEWKHCFYGDYLLANGIGFDDYLLMLKQENLLDSIEEIIINIQANLDLLSNFENDIIDKPEALDNLLSWMAKLDRLMVIDFANALSIDYTISDCNDECE